MYLIGKYDFKVNDKALRLAVSRWFYMASVTYYYTGSFEGKVQQDLNNIGELKTAEQFVEYIDRKISSAFTDDDFNITLPAEFATFAPPSPQGQYRQKMRSPPLLFDLFYCMIVTQAGKRQHETAANQDKMENER